MKYFLGPVNILTQRTTQPGLNPEQQKGNSHTSHNLHILCIFGGFCDIFLVFCSMKVAQLKIFSLFFTFTAILFIEILAMKPRITILKTKNILLAPL